MKCPKCGYLGFETTDRCRNCGYDFSLTAAPPVDRELPLRPTSQAGDPLEDFDLAREHAGTEAGRKRDSAEESLMAFEAEPPLASPPPARAPLAVRRATPDLPRSRSRVTPRPKPGATPTLDLEAPSDAAASRAAPARRVAPTTAGAGVRLVAALIDFLLLGAIDAAVVLLTLRIAGLELSADDLSVLSPIPMSAFFTLLALGYLIGFTAGGGQTIGKMVVGVRVTADDDTHVDVAGAVIRSLGVLASLATFGLLYLPVVATSDRRAVHDRLAGTRVVKVE
jgi:uncharacterized RDD family membrane protein YckC